MNKTNPLDNELINHIQAGIGIIDENDRLKFVNPRMAQLLGYPAQDMLGHPIAAFIKPEQEILLQTKLSVLKGGRNFFLPVIFICKDGRQLECLLSFSGIHVADLGYQGAAFFILDIQQDLFLQLLIERQVLQKERELSGLNKVMTEIARSQDLKRLLNLVFTSIQTATGFDGGGYFNYQNKLTTLYAHPQSSFIKVPEEVMAGLGRICRERPELLSKRIWSLAEINPSPEHVRLHRAFIDLIYPQKEAETVNMSFFAHSDSNKSQCVFGFFHQSEQAFTAEMIELADIITSHAAVAIENMFLIEEKESLAKESERLKVSRELHDSVAQGIYSLMLYGEASQRALNANKIEVVAENLEEMNQLSREAMSELRLLIFELRPPMIEEIGFSGAIMARLESVEKRSGTHAECHIYGEPALMPEAENELYWIVHEALNNVLKHAKAKNVSVDIHFNRNTTRVIVQDNGIGFNTESDGYLNGIGLKSMAERTERLGGTIKVVSDINQGTRVEVFINQIDENMQ